MLNRKLFKKLCVGVMVLGLLTPIAVNTVTVPQVTVQAKRHYRIRRKRKTHKRYKHHKAHKHHHFVGKYLYGKKIHFNKKANMYYIVNHNISNDGVVAIRTPRGEQLKPNNRSYYTANDLKYTLDTNHAVTNKNNKANRNANSIIQGFANQIA